MNDHPSGKPIRPQIIKAGPALAGRRTEPIVARLGERPIEWLAGGCGFPINPTYDEYWELRGREPERGARREPGR